jgi:hypothetical protein
MEQWADSLREAGPSKPEDLKGDFDRRMDSTVPSLGGLTQAQEAHLHKLQQDIKNAQRQWLTNHRFSENAVVREENGEAKLFHDNVLNPAIGYDIIGDPTFPTLSRYSHYFETEKRFKAQNAAINAHGRFH